MSDTAAGSLPIIYRDDSLIAIHKPAGPLVHCSVLDRRETRFALQIRRDQIGQKVYPVHRLDKGSSGVLLFALDREVGRVLTSPFERGEVAKCYVAVVRGYPPASGEYPTAPPPARANPAHTAPEGCVSFTSRRDNS